ncbi:MAG: AMP-binding protein [Bacteroidales bacterium]
MINKKNLEKIALITKDFSFSYQQLIAEINRYSFLLENKEYKKVAIFSENRSEWIFAFYAAWKFNCVVVPIDSGADINDVTFILNDCKPELVFTSKDLSSKIVLITEKLTYQPEVFIFGNEIPHKQTDDNSWLNPADLNKNAVIIYTSGTTGNPKGVMLSYKNIISNIRAVSDEVKIYTPERQVLMLLPMHHVFPLVGSMIAPLYIGGTIVMSPSMQSPDLLETLKNNKVNIMLGVPRLYELLYKGLKSKIFASFAGRLFYRIVKISGSKALAKKIFNKVHQGLGGHIKVLVSGGASLNPEVGGFFYTLGFDILEGYGMTEAAPMITFTRPGRIKIGSPGEPLPGIEIEIREGEIVAKGDNIMLGYFNKPEETAETLKDGWLYTGDLGYFDKKEFLHITGRKKDIIVLANGKNISPVEIENKLTLSTPAIKEAAVFLLNEQLHAVIVPDFKFLSDNNTRDVQKYFREEVFPLFNSNLSSYKRIMQFTLVKDELPRTKLGKIQRYKLEDFIEKSFKKTKPSTMSDSEEYTLISKFIQNEVDSEISPDDHIEYDIALDSLGKISLIDFIDRTFGVKLNEDHLISFPSVKHLVDHVKNNKLWHKLESINWSETLKQRVNIKLPKTWPTLNLFKNASKGFFSIYFRFKGDGYQYVPDGPCIIAANHQSFFDGLFVASFLKRKTMKATYFYAKKEHVNNWFLKFLARKNNVIIMDLNKGLQESIQKMAEVLHNGKKIIIFPEGTRTKDGLLGEFKKTFAILSKELSVPVVPVAIRGAFKALPKGKIIPRIFSPIEVSFLEPVYPQNFNHDSLALEVQRKIDSALKN